MNNSYTYNILKLKDVANIAGTFEVHYFKHQIQHFSSEKAARVVMHVTLFYWEFHTFSNFYLV